MPLQAFARSQPPDAILLAGPTTSGKSSLAMELARRLNGVVVNADSMQVYRDLRILTARPSVEEEARVSHALFGYVDGARNYSVGCYLADVERTLEGLRAQGRLPILTGGTGLYFKALLEGLSDIPPVPERVRKTVRAEAEGCEPAALYERLKRLDPLTASTLKPSDPSRILRALEVFETTGQPLASFYALRKPALLAQARTTRVFLAPNRETVYARINQRFEGMIANGALEEIEHLGKRALDPALPVMRAHGVPWLLQHYQGTMLLAQAVTQAQADTRHYAKRQFTWFRNQMPGWMWIDSYTQEAEKIAADVICRAVA